MTADEIRQCASIVTTEKNPTVQHIQVVMQCEIAAQLAELNAQIREIAAATLPLKS